MTEEPFARLDNILSDVHTQHRELHFDLEPFLDVIEMKLKVWPEDFQQLQTSIINEVRRRATSIHVQLCGLLTDDSTLNAGRKSTYDHVEWLPELIEIISLLDAARSELTRLLSVLDSEIERPINRASYRVTRAGKNSAEISESFQKCLDAVDSMLNDPGCYRTEPLLWQKIQGITRKLNRIDCQLKTYKNLFVNQNSKTREFAAKAKKRLAAISTMAFKLRRLLVSIDWEKECRSHDDTFRKSVKKLQSLLQIWLVGTDPERNTDSGFGPEMMRNLVAHDQTHDVRPTGAKRRRSNDPADDNSPSDSFLRLVDESDEDSNLTKALAEKCVAKFVDRKFFAELTNDKQKCKKASDQHVETNANTKVPNHKDITWFTSKPTPSVEN